MSETRTVDLSEKKVTYEVNGESVTLTPNMIKKYLVSGNAEVTDQEVILFLNLCRYQKLNPFLNEAYLVKFKNNQGPDKPAQMIVSKEAFMKRAESHPQYDGLEAGIIVSRDNELVEIEGAVKLPKDTLVGGWAKVYRKDRTRPVSVKISEAEFNKKQSTWNSMPLTMMRKTSIVNGLREAFPKDLGAMYTEEETPLKEADAVDQVQENIKNHANKEVIDFTATEQIPEVADTKAMQDFHQQSFFKDLTTKPIEEVKEAEPTTNNEQVIKREF